jgi:hypothetical protein
MGRMPLVTRMVRTTLLKRRRWSWGRIAGNSKRFQRWGDLETTMTALMAEAAVGAWVAECGEAA